MFKVGDKVIDKQKRIGIVVDNDYDNGEYCVLVRYINSKNSRTFTIDGKYLIMDEKPSLWHCTPLEDVLV